MIPELRKVVTYDEDVHSEGGRPSEPVLRMIGVAAVVSNPWAGRGFVEDLSPEIQRMAPVLGKMLTDRLIALAGSGDAIEAYGKACIAGTSSEVEHASALIHTLQFGTFYRAAVGAKKSRQACNAPAATAASAAPVMSARYDTTTVRASDGNRAATARFFAMQAMTLPL